MAKQKQKWPYITVVGWRNNIFKFLAIKYINPHKVALCMSMLSSFWSGNFNNLFKKNSPKINRLWRIEKTFWMKTYRIQKDNLHKLRRLYECILIEYKKTTCIVKKWIAKHIPRRKFTEPIIHKRGYLTATILLFMQ